MTNGQKFRFVLTDEIIFPFVNPVRWRNFLW